MPTQMLSADSYIHTFCCTMLQVKDRAAPGLVPTGIVHLQLNNCILGLDVWQSMVGSLSSLTKLHLSSGNVLPHSTVEFATVSFLAFDTITRMVPCGKSTECSDFANV